MDGTQQSVGESVSAPARLRVIRPENAPRFFALDQKEHILGRKSSASIVLEDPSVSREHARLHLLPGQGWWLEDLKSRNGIYINGSRIQNQALKDGDLIRIGSFLLQFELDLPQKAVPGFTSRLAVSVDECAVHTWAPSEKRRLQARHVEHLLEFAKKLSRIAEPEQRNAAFCQLLVDPFLEGISAQILAVDRAQPDLPGLVCGPVFSRSTARRESSRISISVLRALLERNEGIVASNFQSTSADLELTLGSCPAPACVIACPLVVREESLDLLYAEFPPECANPEWFSMVLMAARVWHDSNETWQARIQAMQLIQDKELADAASKAKSDFIATMSHEVRTPLNAIVGYTELLIEETENQSAFASFRQDLAKIRDAGVHLLSLINNILDLSKIEAGKMELCLENFEIEPLLRQITGTIQPLIGKNGNTFELVLGPDLGRMESDLVKLRQSLFNLISNAAKFTENGTITLRAQRQKDSLGEWIQFEVADSGIGMSEEQAGKLFQPFVQAEANISRRFGGTGLGLALVKKFTELLGGTVNVQSAPGSGTTFAVRLPAKISKGE